ncbi:hypothetical protein GGTG_07341 [Gaeumannomyces tritici R3-111a-1]|uniref:Uncharacterized protein n=1 Tax=Gaeumannomyces tritici (strain R3-111a-1) TaxID=644352 RepID=J3P1E4_GAET3|nr:hypothetical protein GGTG_07341 [Gaeumannomyces tritici R3-111a-1]EJT77429.1 hypothetical protein GGTG_07341 [Gaeumannomyces tritici R3-111a-1]
MQRAMQQAVIEATNTEPPQGCATIFPRVGGNTHPTEQPPLVARKRRGSIRAECGRERTSLPRLPRPHRQVGIAVVIGRPQPSVFAVEVGVVGRKGQTGFPGLGVRLELRTPANCRLLDDPIASLLAARPISDWQPIQGQPGVTPYLRRPTVDHPYRPTGSACQRSSAQTCQADGRAWRTDQDSAQREQPPAGWKDLTGGRMLSRDPGPKVEPKVDPGSRLPFLVCGAASSGNRDNAFHLPQTSRTEQAGTRSVIDEQTSPCIINGWLAAKAPMWQAAGGQQSPKRLGLADDGDWEVSS